MRYGPFAALAFGLLASGCDNVAGPGDGPAVYALHRIGDVLVPAPAWPGSKYPLVVADTLTLLTPRPRPGDSLVVSRVQILKEESGRVDNSSGRFNAVLQTDLLTVDSCPIGAFCLAADLLYSPFVLRVVGDSLYEQVPEGSPLKPRVYGRVTAR